MDSSFSLDKLSNHHNYKSRKYFHTGKRSKEGYLNKKRERSFSNKKMKEGNPKSNKEIRYENKSYSYGKNKSETDYRENREKYRPIDVNIHVYPKKYSDKEILKYSKDKSKTDRNKNGLNAKFYSSSVSDDSRRRYNRKHKHTHSTKNSDYSREKKHQRSHKLKSSRSSSSRNRGVSYFSQKYTKRSNHKYKHAEIKYHDDDKSSYKKIHKKLYRNKERDNKKKNSRSSYYRYRYKKRSRSYSPDREHSYSRLGYHQGRKYRDNRKDKKKERSNVRDYSNKSRRRSYSHNDSRFCSDSISRSPSADRRSYSSRIRSSSDSFSSSSKNSKKNKDAGHYDFKIGNILNNKYKIIGLLGDGTFGRCLECLNLEDNTKYGVKVIRPVQRYLDSAKYEADIILEISRADSKNESKIVNMLEYFYFEEKRKNYIALVFEKLGKSLYDFIKDNDYKGFSIENIQEMTEQILEGMAFIHERLKIVHTDLKPENILLKNDEANQIKEKKKWPLENKIQKSKSPSTRSYSREKQDEVYYSPKETAIKIIDFGGATRENERHSEIINTRQYRAPEVILGCCEWNEKSDVWCLACIFSELYSGELLFPTHNNEEHLSLIEKVAGPIPLWMANNSKKEFRRIFDLDFNGIDDRYKVNFQKIYNKREEIISNYEKLETVEEIIAEKHSVFKDFLKTMLIIDPNKRPSCREALNHEFFKTKF